MRAVALWGERRSLPSYVNRVYVDRYLVHFRRQWHTLYLCFLAKRIDRFGSEQQTASILRSLSRLPFSQTAQSRRTVAGEQTIDHCCDILGPAPTVREWEGV